MRRSLASPIAFPSQQSRFPQRAEQPRQFPPPVTHRCLQCGAPTTAHFDQTNRARGCEYAMCHTPERMR